MVTQADDHQLPVYDLVGGRPFFVALVDEFYDLVDDDPIIRPMYPEDLTGSRALMVGFLSQYWGGPTDYSDERGHPRLRMRHAPFTIDEAAKAAWLGHMLAAVELASGRFAVAPEIKTAMDDYFVMGAVHMINTA